jgi:hypothetical protein
VVGYGAAVTVRAVADGLAAGAKWSWLQSSALGYATYARLGFETVETWPCWVALTEHPWPASLWFAPFPVLAGAAARSQRSPYAGLITVSRRK